MYGYRVTFLCSQIRTHFSFNLLSSVERIEEQFKIWPGNDYWWKIDNMSEPQKPKAKFSAKMPNGDFLGFTVWHTKTDPNSEVLSVQVRHPTGDNWETIAKLAVYRGSDGRYALLPDRGEPGSEDSRKASPITSSASSR